MEKEIPRMFQPQRDQSIDRDQHLTDAIRESLKDLELANKRIKDLEALRVSESEDGGNKVYGTALKINEEDYKERLRAANVTIIQLKRRLQEVEEQKNEQLAASKKLMQEKFEGYEKELEESNKTIKWLEDQVVKAKGEADVEEVVNLKEKLFQSEMEVSRKINEITMLKTQLNEAWQASEDASKLRSKLQNALAQCNHISAELQAKNLEYTDVKTKLTSLEQKLQETEQKALNREKQVKLENLKAKDRINELEQELQRAQRNLDSKAQQLLVQQSDSAELTYLRQKLVQSQLALNDAVQAKDIAEADLAEANRQLETLKLKEDELVAVKAQVESYKSDFNAERNSLQTEKDRVKKMSEELQQLQKSNQMLQEEVDVLRRDMYSPGYAPQSCAPSACYMPPPLPYHGYYTCPKCHNTFHNFSQRDAEYHVYHCMT